MTYNSLNIAKAFLNIADRPMTHMKLQKLIYIAHGCYLALNDGEKLIIDEIQAWKYGPVIPYLYHILKPYGNEALPKRVLDDYVSSNIENDDIKALLQKIWDIYKEHSGTELSTLTHQENSPWSKTYNGSVNKPIDDKEITNYYKKELKIAQ